MKWKTLIMIICVSIFVTSCGTSEKSSPTIVITANEHALVYNLIDATKDILITQKPDEDVDFDAEKEIFKPLIDNKKTEVSVRLGDKIQIAFDKLPDSAKLYDHLLKEDGTSYFNRSIYENDITFENKNVTIDLSAHPSMALASSKDFFEEKSIRGFRLVTTTGDKVVEYAFIVYIRSEDSIPTNNK